MLAVPFVYVWMRDPGAFLGVVHYGGGKGIGGEFNLHLFGAVLTVGIALITRMGEQADYFRFMPVQTKANRWRWRRCCRSRRIWACTASWRRRFRR
jgi:hypothetical protein